mmetsp:Transcript_25750/g.67425  ORF Transcript_25750/g.67425 Transcript_25750/m.67425 type:complete len:207 (-) Transcript_25750:157-777(-)|eukprot:CAMPEP_0194549168 /NCGR_PEP_ID=MMETSP0253-20130528/94822_1 /TAXON_ID=2966 /ORGANISM="Noctiluca scintillans" /LENGTH=206 /DNA_ID=CAMNT_0039396575 /DNA_START=72 /DNA_END=692 /DNA_ORIENTATION=+
MASPLERDVNPIEMERRRFFHQIGLSAVEDRREDLERRAECIRETNTLVFPPSRCSSESPSWAASRISQLGTRHCPLADVEQARRDRNRRVDSIREELLAGWRRHEVSVVVHPARPQPPGTDLIYRQPRRRVSVGRDERRIDDLPDTAVDKRLKRALRTMRENLFQRRICHEITARVGDCRISSEPSRRQSRVSVESVSTVSVNRV